MTKLDTTRKELDVVEEYSYKPQPEGSVGSVTLHMLFVWSEITSDEGD